ncbi:glycolate oxidase FAD binding subunit [Pseudomonas aeruginosa]|nr:glycolate oxidase FAD binding subunit [Pseudomonas aeruginosa]
MSQPYFDPDAGADHAGALLERVRDALARRAPLRIVGGDSKAFLGRPVAGEPLALAEHRGIVAYDPCELVITARAGTPLDELQAVLARGGQMLACEAPGFGGRATVGGVLASGLSGPRRPWAGAVRDFVLGTRLISGLGTHLRFGGEVMKNVAGYDLSRLLAGSFGCLGVVTEVSFKVLAHAALPGRPEPGPAGGDGVAQAGRVGRPAIADQCGLPRRRSPAPAPGGRRGLGTLGARPPRWRSARGRLLGRPARAAPAVLRRPATALAPVAAGAGAGDAVARSSVAGLGRGRCAG